MWYMGTHYIVHTGVQMHALLPPDCTTRFYRTCSTVILAQSFINACTVTVIRILFSILHFIYFFGVNAKMWRFGIGAAQTKVR